MWHMRGIDDAVAVACRKDIAKHCDKNPFRCANKQKSTRKLTLMSDDNDRETARLAGRQAGTSARLAHTYAHRDVPANAH